MAGAAVQLMCLAGANSRTGFLIFGVGVLIIVLLNVNRPETLIRIGLAAFVGMAMIAVVSPGTPRLILDLFTGQSSDRNVELRVSRIPLVLNYLDERPFIGAGYLTNDARQRQLWDNSYLGALSEGGMLSAISFFLFISAVAVVGAKATIRSRLTDIAASGAFYAGVGLLVGGTTFDAWQFAQYFPTCLCLMAAGLAQAQSVEGRGRREAAATAVEAIIADEVT
jgi:O-antigen ligase